MCTSPQHQQIRIARDERERLHKGHGKGHCHPSPHHNRTPCRKASLTTATADGCRPRPHLTSAKDRHDQYTYLGLHGRAPSPLGEVGVLLLEVGHGLGEDGQLLHPHSGLGGHHRRRRRAAAHEGRPRDGSPTQKQAKTRARGIEEEWIRQGTSASFHAIKRGREEHITRHRARQTSTHPAVAAPKPARDHPGCTTARRMARAQQKRTGRGRLPVLQ